jgi:hypothetical protein
MTNNHKTCDVLECVCGVPWEPDSEQFGCWSCGSTYPSCAGCKYDNEETRCTHPKRGAHEFVIMPISECHTVEVEKAARSTDQ